MFNRINTRYLLRIFFISAFLIASIILSQRSYAFSVTDDIIEKNTISYLEKDYKGNDVAFIYFNEKDLNQLGYNPSSFNENLTALLNNHLSRANAVVLDFLIPTSDNQHIDESLAAALNAAQTSVISYEDKGFGIIEAKPDQQFIKNASYTGYRNFYVDYSGNADRYYPLLQTNSNARSLIISAAEANNVKIGVNTKNMLSVSTPTSSEVVHLADDLSFKRLPINFPIRKVYSAKNVLSGMYQPYEFDSTTVFIGFENDIVKTSFGNVKHAEYTANGVVGLVSNYTYRYASVFQTILFSFLLLTIVLLAERSPKWWVRFSVVVLMIIIALFLNFLAAKYLHIFFKLSLPITFSVLIFLFSTFSAYFVVREELVRDSSIMNEILVLNNIRISESTFTNYLISIAPSILQKSGVEIVRPEIYQDAPILQKIFSTGDLNQKEVIFKRGYILIPLQKYRKDAPLNRYCLLKSKLLVSDASVKNIIAFILSIDFHFKHIIETERENKLLYSVIEGIILSLNARDAITGEHSRRVAEFSVQIGGWLGYSEEQLEKLYFASLIHDIGKIGISDAILAKPSFYSDDDFEIMKRHPELGIEIMGGFIEDQDITSAILQHHERPDGRGYPNGISGDEIRPIARIIKIADVYDALTSSRHYKDAWPLEKVCDVFYEGRGTEFDEILIDLVIDHIKPAGWVPNHKQEEYIEQYFSDDLKSMAIDIYKNSMYSARSFKSAEPSKESINFAKLDAILGLELGDSILTSNFLYKKPTLVLSFEEKETAYYAKSNEGNYQNAVLVFLRNYLTGGSFISGLGEAKDTFADEVKASFGEPIFKDKSLTAWASPNGQEYYVLFESQSPELANVFVYFNKYLVFADLS